MLYGTDTLICYAMLLSGMGQRSTYFTDEEEEQIEQLAKEKDDSFSGVVRKAIQEQYDL